MAGEYPAGYDELETRRRLQGLIRAGIRSFIDLTHPDDTMFNYVEILNDEANGYLVKINYSHFPIIDRSVPSKSEMGAILDAIDKSIVVGNPPYIHCIAGVGRTGTVVGCYLIRHGMKPDEAIIEIKKLRKDIPSHWARSPEADEQVDFILNWKPGL